SASCTGATTITCALGVVPLGATATANIVVTTTAVGTITNTATVSADQTDLNAANNASTASAQVLPSTDTKEELFLTDQNSPRLLEIDPVAGTLLNTFHTGSTPAPLVVSPNGRIAYVGNIDSNFVSVVDLTIKAEIARIRGLQVFREFALTSDGTKL